jgi:NLR family CARD domain-containing protein 3
MKISLALAVEFGLMSTTASRETAVAYSGKDGQRCTVLEIAAGRVDVGADIGFLSQYPGEREFLMQPLACLEVRKESCVDIVCLPQAAQSLPT